VIKDAIEEGIEEGSECGARRSINQAKLVKSQNLHFAVANGLF